MSAIDLLFGPQHPALHEPEHFRFIIDGDVVVNVEPRLGYVHRGIERLFQEHSYVHNLYISERICGICNVAHTTCYVNVVEKVLGVDPPKRGKYLRVVINELNRLHSHLLLLGVVAELLGFDTLFMLIWRDREAVMDMVELMTGNRLLASYNAIGGVKRDIDEHVRSTILKGMDRLEERAKEYRKVFSEDPTVLERTQGVGILRREDAIRYCVVGPVLRGSGIKSDVRIDDPYDAYGEIPFKAVVYRECDSWARFMVRADEVFESINIIRYALRNLPEGDVRVVRPVRNVIPGEAVARVEAPRGELLYHLISRGGPKPYRLKVRTPTLANIYAAAEMFKGNRVADIPVILGSIDPCFACMDRITLVDAETGKVVVKTGRELMEVK